MNANDAIPKPNVTVAAVIERDGGILLVTRSIEDYLAGRSYPLELITHYA